MKRFILLDRDGTIIVNKHYQKDPAVTELLPGAKEGVELLRSAGFKLVLVSNQSGIGRGLLTEEDLAAVNRSMVALLGLGEDVFEGMYHCPHVDADGCRCRKPLPGMIEDAGKDLAFQPAESWMIGDSAADIEAGRAAGAGTVLVRTGNGAAVEARGEVHPDFVADDLQAAAQWIVGREGLTRP